MSDLITAEQVCQLAGISISRFKGFRKQIGAPDKVAKQENQFLYSKSEYEKWLQSNNILELCKRIECKYGSKRRSGNQKQQPTKLNLELINKFITGKYLIDELKNQHQIKLNQARQNQPLRHIISVYQEYDLRQD